MDNHDHGISKSLAAVSTRSAVREAVGRSLACVGGHADCGDFSFSVQIEASTTTTVTVQLSAGELAISPQNGISTEGSAALQGAPAFNTQKAVVTCGPGESRMKCGATFDATGSLCGTLRSNAHATVVLAVSDAGTFGSQTFELGDLEVPFEVHMTPVFGDV